MMSRAFSFTFRRLVTYLHLRRDKLATIMPFQHYLTRGNKLLIGSQVFCAAVNSEGSDKIDVDNSLSKACEEGDEAILRLLEKLRDIMIIVSLEYRTCLNKQIEITVAASNIGPISEMWDELPQYRTLAAELHKELNEYIALFNTIGQMADEESLIQFVSGSRQNLDLVSLKYKELENLLQREFEKNRILEAQLLKIKRDSILKGVSD